MVRALNVVATYSETESFNALVPGQRLDIAASLNTVKAIGQGVLQYSVDDGATWKSLESSQESPVIDTAIVVRNVSPNAMCAQVTELAYIKAATQNQGGVEIELPFSDATEGGGGGGGDGTIAIPTSNEGLNLVLVPEDGGSLLLGATAPETGDVPYVEIAGAQAQENGAQGGYVSMFGGAGATGGGGGGVSLDGGAGDSGSGALGAGISIDGGESGANANGGRLHLKVGVPTGSGAKGVFRISDTNGDPVSLAPNGQTVTITGLGPGDVAVEIAAWWPIRDGDSDYVIPLFSAQV